MDNRQCRLGCVSMYAIIYPTDFVRTDFSRTDEMPYRKKCFHDTDIYTFFLAFSRAENRITLAENKES